MKSKKIKWIDKVQDLIGTSPEDLMNADVKTIIKWMVDYGKAVDELDVWYLIDDLVLEILKIKVQIGNYEFGELAKWVINHSGLYADDAKKLVDKVIKPYKLF